MYQSQVNMYQENAVTMASKEKLILLAYEGAMRFINQARMNIERGNIPAKCDRISKAMAVIEELACSLNMEEGGEIAERLSALYDYMMRQLVMANLKSDPKVLDEVLSLLKTLYSAWTEVIEKPKIEMSITREPVRMQQMAA